MIVSRRNASVLLLVSVVLLVYCARSTAFTIVKFPVHEIQPVKQSPSYLRSTSADEEIVPINEDAAAWEIRAMTFTKLDSKTEPALLSDFLMELGACSVSITDHDKDTDLEDPLFLEPSEEDTADIFAAVVCGDAAVGKNIWMRCDVVSILTPLRLSFGDYSVDIFLIPKYGMYPFRMRILLQRLICKM